MRTFIPLIAFLQLISTFSFAQQTFPADGQRDADAVYYLLSGGYVHRAPGITDSCDVLVYQGKIVSCGLASEMDIPANTVSEDVSGKHLFPSFIEMNSSYGIEPLEKRTDKLGPEFNRQHNRALYWNETIRPEMDAVNRFTPKQKEAKTFREKGFGYTLSQLEDGIARGSSVLTMTGDGIANKNVVKSEAAMNYSFHKGSSVQDYPTSMMGAIALLRQSFYDAEWYENSSPQESNFSLEAYSKNSTLPKIFSADNSNDLNRIARLANEFETNFIVLGSGHAYELGPEFAEGISAVVAPLNLPKPIDMSDPDLGRYVNQSDLLHWERAPFNPFYIQSIGVDLVLSGAEIANAKDFFGSLQKTISVGLDADTALAALTTTPAKILGVSDIIGKIEPGYKANFFVASGDVFLDEEASILSHWLSGKVYLTEDPHAIDLSGMFTLNVDDHYHILEVKKSKDYKARVLHIEGKDTAIYAAAISQIGHEVNLFFNDSTHGNYRLSGTVISDNRIWDGRGTDENGNQIVWSAIRRLEDEKSAVATPEETDSIPKPPAMQYPMTAYGFDSIPEAATILFTNATLWTNDSLGIVKNGSIFIKDGIIVAVGTGVQPNAFLSKKEKGNYATVNLKGKHITPGIIDEHSHIALERGVNEAGQASTAEVRISDALNPKDINIYRQLSGGVTTSQLLHGSANPIGGQSAIIKLRWGQSYENMLMKEASNFIKFALGENVKQSNWGDHQKVRFPQTRMGVEQVYYDYFYRAKEYGELKALAESSAKGSKKSNKKSAPKPVFRTDLELEALLEILEKERFITCHSYQQGEINMLMHVADSMNFTLNTFTHILEGYKVADKMKAHGAAASTFSDWWAYKFEVNDAIPQNAALLHEMGVVTAINSDDAEMGRRLNQEAAKSIKYGGMSEEDALKMITLNPAKMLHIDEYVGSLEPGKHADFVIWSGNPLSIYTKAESTFIDGIKYFDRMLSKEMEARDQVVRAKIADKMANEIKGGSPSTKPVQKTNQQYHCDTID